ncbi:MAG: polysaccharide deacetylase family protein [Chloroflexi bacterium]|nr:polysaccharide deacetylase family protein [Chloroflexota bacterium]
MRVGSRESGVGSLIFPSTRFEKGPRLPSPRSEGRRVGDEGRHPITLVLLLCATLFLGGCAAGAPSVVAPVASESSEVLAPESGAAQDNVAEAAAPEPGPTTAEVQPVAIEQPAEVVVAPESMAPPESNAISSTDTAAFAQAVPTVAAPLPETTVLVEDTVGGAAPPVVQIERPAAPPDPGTGLSTIVEGGVNGRLEVALTFDAGADTGYGAEILDLLRDEGIPATFGMTGIWAQANPDLVQRMVAEGHQLMNHTWDHSSLTGANTGMPAQTADQVAQQLADTEAVVRDLTGYEMRPYFRPPYGDYDEVSLGYLYDNGYYLSIWWTCDTRGWAGWGAQEIIDYCTTNIAEDEILLLHVGAAAAGDFEALPGLIQFFRDSGYAFVTIEQMLQP